MTFCLQGEKGDRGIPGNEGTPGQAVSSPVVYIIFLLHGCFVLPVQGENGVRGEKGEQGERGLSVRFDWQRLKQETVFSSHSRGRKEPRDNRAHEETTVLQ